MKMMHQGLKQDHKLKYNGRIHDVFFFNGVGMLLGDTLTYFKTHFTKIMTTDDFKNQYLYSIRHLPVKRVREWLEILTTT